MNTTTKTVEQLKEELRIAQEAVAEQERIDGLKKQVDVWESKAYISGYQPGDWD